MMEEKQKRELYEGYLAMQHNPCWQWLYGETARRVDYLAQRLRQAADWPQYCRLCGELAALEALCGQIAFIAAGFREPAEANDQEGRDADGDEFWPVAGGV